MNLPDQIQTIDEFKESTLVEKKSTFIAQVYPVDSEETAKEILSEIKKKYFDASHHCFAYKFADGNFRYSDAGEPSGTAGVRILMAIDHFKLINIIVIVTRYFGGTKLGVGPLGKAYYNATHQVLKESKIVKKHLLQKVKITTGFEHIELVHRILSNFNSVILNTQYEIQTKFSCLIRCSEIDIISQKLSKLGKNKIILTTNKEFVYK